MESKILIYENSEEIRKIRIRTNYGLRAYNTLYKAYMAIKPDLPLEVHSITQLYELAYDVEGIVRQSYLKKMPKTFEIGGVRIRQEAVSSHIEMPDLSDLKEAATRFRQAARGSEEKVTEYEFYKISDREVILDEEAIGSEVEVFRIYADTPEEITLYKMLRELCDRLNEAKEYFGTRFSHHDKVEEELRVVVKRNGKFFPNHQFIKIKK